MSGSALPTILIENDRVRVTKWCFPRRGDNTGWHRHAHDYIVIPHFTGTLEIAHADGTRSLSHLTDGVPYFREAGVEHDVISANDAECAFTEVELLQPPPPVDGG